MAGDSPPSPLNEMNTAERTHSELERHHYQEVASNPFYAAEGMMDVRMEEFAMNIPVTQEVLEVKEIPEKPWMKKQWHIVEQLKAERLNLIGKFLDLEKRIYILEERVEGKGGTKYAYK